jgi:dTMP kinase
LGAAGHGVKRKGFFISFEGGEGTGKSTQLRLLTAWLKKNAQSPIVTLEPGGTPIGEKIRDLLLDPKNGRLSPRAELLLYEADRAQHVDELIEPELSKGSILVCDRYADSSYVYQGICRKLGEPRVADLNRFATRGLMPDLTIVLDLPETEGLKRIRKRLEEDAALHGIRRRVKLDRLEREKTDFHRRVRQGFLKLARKEPRRIRILDASQSVEAVFEQVRSHVEPALKRRRLWQGK